MLYIITGTISSFFFVGCLFGLYEQIKKIRMRRKLYINNQKNIGYATQSMSVNGFFSSFIAFYAFFIYSMTLDSINFFIFFIRFFACLATSYILFEIYRDNNMFRKKIPFFISISVMILSIFILYFRKETMAIGKYA